MKIHQFIPVWGLASASPFCLKLQAYCRMAGIDYEVVNDPTPSKSPTKKLPYAEMDDGRVVGDSGVIVDELERNPATALDGRLTEAQKSQALAYRRLLEESLYATLLMRRWADPEGWAATRQSFFGEIPQPVRAAVSALVRKSVIKSLWGHGRGRFDFATAYALGNADLTALSVALGDKPFFFGDEPASLDASAFGMLAQFTLTPLGGAVHDHALQLGNLEPYCRRIQERYFS